MNFRYSTILFDIDNTLLDSFLAEDTILRCLLSGYGYAADDKLIEKYRSINKNLWKKYNAGIIGHEFLQVERFRTLFKSYKLNISPEYFSALYLESFSCSAYLMDGALDLCRNLHNKRYKLYVISNGAVEIQKKRMALANLSRFFNGFFVSDAVGSRKPQASFFTYVLENIEEKNIRRILAVGDDPDADIMGARRLEIDTCWLCSVNIAGTAIPTYTVHSLRDLEEQGIL
jgi:YjjG family noncanonical pyrimidine nucleotidase